MANRLAEETSPYLLQHAENPVDWYPWGSEAFEKAEAEGKPVHLSIGYAACHWCHVMAHESFEDPGVAAYMNEHFVNIKVDREERPDVDAVYMTSIQAMTGQGGWPMTVFCTPDGTPFLGGTYFPPTDRHGMPSWRKVLERVHELWETRRDDLLAQGNELVRRMEQATPRPSKEPLGGSLLSAAAHEISKNHDPVNGGFGGQPKFPQAPVLEFLLRSDARNGRYREPLERTLRAMALGGIYDQLGGGFHRYTVDAGWLVPHFEKMLYDNAQLARVYTHAWQAYGDPLSRRIAIETLEYCLRDMRDERGGFHSSEDADSEGVEGKFYVWSHDELTRIAPEAAEYYGVTPEGNWEEGKNILTADGPEPPAEARRRLFDARAERVRPGKDDKVLASWNGLLIAALAEAGAAFDRPDLLDAAREAASFVLDEMSDDTGRLLHAYRAGHAKVPSLLEDHAYLVDGLLELWQATFEGRWLAEARRLADEAVERFADPDGGFYTASEEHGDLVVRQKEIAESATPSPGGVLALALERLAVLFDREELQKTATDALRVARIYMDRAPQAAATWLGALDFHLSTPQEIALTGDLASDNGRRLRDTVTGRFLPNRVVAGRPSADGHEVLGDVALLRDKPADGEATAWVCERYVCKRPTSDAAELEAQLSG